MIGETAILVITSLFLPFLVLMERYHDTMSTMLLLSVYIGDTVGYYCLHYA